MPAIAAAILAVSPSVQAAEDVACKLCADAEAKREYAPLRVEIESGIAFSRLALVGPGDGEAEIDAQTGSKFTRGNMMDLGGMPFQGRALITGEPYQPVRIEMPGSVTLRSPGGGEASLTDFATDLPEFPMLDANGRLEFRFGGRLRTIGGHGGNFRGRIPIHVDYD